MLKRELRKKYTLLRAKLSKEEISDKSVFLVNHLIEIPIWDFFYFHVFLNIPEKKEVDTLPLITLLQGRDKNIVVPKISGTNALAHYLLLDSTVLQANTWGVPEPKEGVAISEDKIDVVFIPLLAYDKVGNRVGYGKGFYDVFLEKCNPETLKIGLSLFEPEHEIIEDVNELDVRLDYCVTPNGIHKF